MLKKIIDGLKGTRQSLQKRASNSEDTFSIKENNIFVSKENDIFKIVIRDYMTITDYFEIVDSSDNFKMLNSISSSLLWNSWLQKVNKGVFYVVLVGNRLYNFFIDEDNIKIDVRTKLDFDNKNEKEDITEEKILTFNTLNKEYRYTSFKHDKAGSTYYTKYYDKNRSYNIGVLYLSPREAYEEIQEIINNLVGMGWVRGILNLELLKEYVLADLNSDLPQMKKKVSEND